MKISPVNNNNKKQNVAFKAFVIPKSDLNKVFRYIGDNRLDNAGVVLAEKRYSDIWFTRREIKKADSICMDSNTPGAAIEYLLNQAKKAKTLTWEDCKKAFAPFEDAKKATLEAKMKEKDAYVSGLNELGVN